MFFGKSTNKTLLRLFNGSPPTTDRQLLDELKRNFLTEIQAVISKSHLGYLDSKDDLTRQVLVELTSLLQSRKKYWADWKKDYVESLLPDLVAATHWKLGILQKKKRSSDEIGMVAKHGMYLLPAAVDSLHRFRENPLNHKKRELAEKYLQNDADYNEVTERAMRCVVSLMQYENQSRQVIFAWNSDQTLKIRDGVIDVYLYEQLQLFGCFAKGDNNAFPVQDFHTKLHKFFEHKIHHDESDEFAKDIVQNIFLIFWEKRRAYLNKTFYLDARLNTYFIAAAHRSHQLRPYYEEMKKRSGDEGLDEILSEEEEDNNLGEVVGILNLCLETLSELCRKIFEKRFYGDYDDQLSYETIADLLDKTPDAVEKQGERCGLRLKSCIIEKSVAKGIKLKKTWTVNPKDRNSSEPPEQES